MLQSQWEGASVGKNTQEGEKVDTSIDTAKPFEAVPSPSKKTPQRRRFIITDV